MWLKLDRAEQLFMDKKNIKGFPSVMEAAFAGFVPWRLESSGYVYVWAQGLEGKRQDSRLFSEDYFGRVREPQMIAKAYEALPGAAKLNRGWISVEEASKFFGDRITNSLSFEGTPIPWRRVREKTFIWILEGMRELAIRQGIPTFGEAFFLGVGEGRPIRGQEAVRETHNVLLASRHPKRYKLAKTVKSKRRSRRRGRVASLSKNASGLLEKEILKPGRYVDQNGTEIILTVENIAAFLEGSEQLLANQFRINGFPDHETVNSKERLGRWVKFWQDENGSGRGLFDPKDEEARKLALENDASAVLWEGFDLGEEQIDFCMPRIDIVPQGAVIGTEPFKPSALKLSSRSFGRVRVLSRSTGLSRRVRASLSRVNRDRRKATTNPLIAAKYSDSYRLIS